MISFVTLKFGLFKIVCNFNSKSSLNGQSKEGNNKLTAFSALHAWYNCLTFSQSIQKRDFLAKWFAFSYDQGVFKLLVSYAYNLKKKKLFIKTLKSRTADNIFLSISNLLFLINLL